MGSVFIKRISDYHDKFVHLIGSKPDDIFVAEYPTEKGQRQYTGVIFFYKNWVGEVENLTADDPNMWIAPLNKNIQYIGLIPKNFDFKVATSESRLNFNCKWRYGDFIFDYNASGHNCLHISELLKKHIFPNFLP